MLVAKGFTSRTLREVIRKEIEFLLKVTCNPLTVAFDH